MFSECMDSPCCASEAAQPRSGVEQTQQQQPGLPGSRLVSGVVSAQGEPRILEPLVQERVVEVMKEEIQERVIEVPQVQYVDRYVEVPQHVVQEKVTQIAKPVIQERVKHVHKPVYQEKIIEVPQVKVVDKIVEVPQYIYQEKIVEVPRVIVQERVIPVPRKVIKEKIVEIDQVDYRDVAVDRPAETTEIIHEEQAVEKPVIHVVEQPVDVEKVVEVPHIQHTYRNVMTPQYRHIPKPVEVPMTHYRPIPVEKIVDRNVPVPVELQIIQEYLCPKIEPRYKEVPVPIHVQRTIEHPVPKEAMGHPQLLPLYYHGAQEIGKAQGVFQRGGLCYSLSSCCAPQRDAITELDKAGPVEILAQQGYSSMPLPAHWDQAQPPAGWEGWSSEQVPTSMKADREMAARLAAVPVQSYNLESQQHVPQMTTQTVASEPQREGRVSTQEQAASSAEASSVRAPAGPYVRVVITPVKPGEKSEVNLFQ